LFIKFNTIYFFDYAVNHDFVWGSLLPPFSTWLKYCFHVIFTFQNWLILVHDDEDSDGEGGRDDNDHDDDDDDDDDSLLLTVMTLIFFDCWPKHQAIHHCELHQLQVLLAQPFTTSEQGTTDASSTTRVASWIAAVGKITAVCWNQFN